MTCRPSACTANIVHAFTDTPSSSTVQAPQDDVSQPTLVPVSPQTSRRYCTSRSLGSTSSLRSESFTVKETCIAPPIPGRDLLDRRVAPTLAHDLRRVQISPRAVVDAVRSGGAAGPMSRPSTGFAPDACHPDLDHR